MSTNKLEQTVRQEIENESAEEQAMSEFEMMEFERDFCIGMNMMLGQSYDEAQVSAQDWMREARE